MATKFVVGEVVKLIAVIPEGPVQAIRMEPDGTFYYLIEWVDVDGNLQSRWFEEDQLVAV